MHRTLAATLALPLLLGAGAAMADSTTGVVEAVDPSANTVTVKGVPYIVEGQAAGPKLDEIKVGDKITIEYDVNTNDVSAIMPAK